MYYTGTRQSVEVTSVRRNQIPRRPSFRAMVRSLLRHLLRHLLQHADCSARHSCAFFFARVDSTTADSLAGRSPSPPPMFTTWYPPSPLVSWNHRVGGNFLLRSLNPKDLQVKSFRNKDLTEFLGLWSGGRRVPYPLSNSRVLLTRYAMKMGCCAPTTLLLSKIVPAYAGPPERCFRSKER